MTNNILIISLMEGFPWGGSEELWYRTAKHAKSIGSSVSVCIKKWHFDHDKIIELQNLGCIIYKRNTIRETFFKKNIQRLFSIKFKSSWSFLYKKEFDHILISFGGAYDILSFKELIEFLEKTKINFSIIQQFNFENIYLKEFNRLKARNIFSKASNIFFVSLRNKMTTERNLVCNLSNSHIISNPANLKKIDQNLEYPINNTKISFACVARFDVGIKNQDLLIEAFASSAWSQRSFRLNLYGKGEGESYLKLLIAKYDLQHKIFIQGYVDNIQKVWENNHVMILPSSAEGSPLSIIEAMYCSRAIIATDVAGNSELIDDNCGFLIPGVNIASIISTLEKVWQKKDDLKQMGLYARDRIKKIHDTMSHVKVYNMIISKK